MEKKMLGIFAVMLLLLSASAWGQYVTPDMPAVIPGTAGVIAGAGIDPVVQFAWVLPDEDNLTTGTQIEIIASGERCDIFACIVVSDANSRETISDVFVDVYHPDGSKKYQVHAQRITERADFDYCRQEAVKAGLLTPEQSDSIRYNTYDQQIWYMYKVFLPMYYHQPAGTYEARAFAVDNTARVSAPRSAFFDWVPATYLELDFNSINFGNVQPGAADVFTIINGDTNMGTPAAPTVKNEGNTEIRLGIEFSDFIGQSYGKIIDRFDAQLRSMEAIDNYEYAEGLYEQGEHKKFNSNTKVNFAEPISLCRTEKLDLSIHADTDILADTYNGTLTVYATAVGQSSPPYQATFPIEGSCP
jgi:hypothetical protein